MTTTTGAWIGTQYAVAVIRILGIPKTWTLSLWWWLVRTVALLPIVADASLRTKGTALEVDVVAMVTWLLALTEVPLAMEPST